MNRRTAVKNLAFIAGAAALLPACSHARKAESKASVPLKHLEVSAAQEKLLAEVCETIVPKTDTPGAKDLGVHLYVLKMLDDCCEKQEQQSFMVGMSELESVAKQQHAQPFVACSAQQKLKLLQGIEQQKTTGDLASFYRTAKRLTVGGYTNSKYFLTTQIVYELVPGRYNGYFPIKNIKSSQNRNGQS